MEGMEGMETMILVGLFDGFTMVVEEG